MIGSSLLKSTEIVYIDMLLGCLSCVNSTLDEGCCGSIWLPHNCRWLTPPRTTGIRGCRLGATLALVR